VGPRAVLDAVLKRKIPSPQGEKIKEVGMGEECNKQGEVRNVYNILD
jgi:hypothetical protein